MSLRPPDNNDECPACGEPTVRTLVRRIRGVEYVDHYCTSCDWRDEDTEGGT